MQFNWVVFQWIIKHVNKARNYEPVFYPFSIKTSNCSGSCNNINDPYAKISVPDVRKDLKYLI